MTDLLALVPALRRLNLDRSRLRLPAAVPAVRIEQRYERAAWGVVGPALTRATRAILDELLDVIPAPGPTQDADRIKRATARARKSAEKAIGKKAGKAARANLKSAATHARVQLRRQVKAAIGVDVFAESPGLRANLDRAVRENIELLKSIPKKHFSRLEKRVRAAVAEGTSVDELAEEIRLNFLRADIREGDLAIAKRRAELVARDQVQKMVAEETRLEQLELGINRYVWRTALDERVRPEHAEREGRTFAWSDPPFDGHPGEPINCRCYAEPVFDEEAISEIEGEGEQGEDLEQDQAGPVRRGVLDLDLVNRLAPFFELPPVVQSPGIPAYRAREPAALARQRRPGRPFTRG